MKLSAKNILLKTIVPVLFCGLTASSALAAKPVKKQQPHFNFPAYFLEEENTPVVSRGYEPPRSPQFSDQFGS